MDSHNVPEALPDPEPGPDVPATESPGRKPGVPPDSEPKSPHVPATPGRSNPLPVPPTEKD